MKKVMLSAFAAFAFVLLFSGNASAQTFNAIENQAIAAASQCAQPYHAPHSTTYAELVSTPRCINGGTVYVFDIYVAYSCPPPQLALCLVPAPVKVATVTTDCDGKVSSVICHTPY